MQSVHHVVPSTYLCHSEQSGIWNDPQSSAGETPLWLAWCPQSQESRWRDRQRKGCNTQRDIRTFVGELRTIFLLQSSLAHLCKQAAHKPQVSRRKSKQRIINRATDSHIQRDPALRRSCGIKITSSSSYSASSSLQWGSRVWLPAIQPEKGFPIAQRWLRAICMHNSTLTSLGICLFLPPIKLTSRDANVKAIPVPIRLQPRNQTGRI